MKMRFAAALLALVVILSLFAVPGIARAVRSLFGYIPGVGRVEQGAALRVLAAPVQDSRGGYTLTVESAVLDSTRTVITYRALGDFPRWDDPTLRPPMCLRLPVLRLPDGTMLANPSGEGGAYEGVSTWKLIYGPLPAGVNQAELEISCLPDLPAGDGPRDWTFALVFAPAPPALTVYPVVELPTAAPTDMPAAASTPMERQATATPDLRGITWTLNGMAVLTDGYYLETTLAWPPDPKAYEIQLYSDALHLVDAAGQEAAVWQAWDGAPYGVAETGSMPLNLQTTALGSPGAARITLDYLGVSRFADTTFTVDVGSDPQPGMVWPVQQDLELDGHHLRVLSAKYVETPPGAPVMLLVDLESDSGIIAVIASDLEHEKLDSGGRPASSEGPMQVGWHYSGAFPSGTITVTVSMFTERLDGPWTLAWTPPADTITPQPVFPTAMPTLRPELALCQAGPLLETAVNTPPAGLGGRIAYNQGGEVFVSNLDGSGLIALGPGVFPALSPDGQQVIYRGEDLGLYVRDLTSGAVRLPLGAPQPGVHHNWPMWSPDGRQIAFDRYSPDHVVNLYVMDADGANLRAVTSGTEGVVMAGWNADGTGLYYRAYGRANGSAYGDGGHSFRLLDLATGQSTEIARLPKYTLTASLSPDGSRLLYVTEQALWIDRLDGSPPVAVLATNGHFANQLNPHWSPDGRWVTINYWETPDTGMPGLALLEVDGCKLVHLAGYSGAWVSGWVR